MNWDKFERSKSYYLIPLVVWWGFALLSFLSDKNGFIIGIPLLIGGFIITRKHYRKQKRLLGQDKQ